MELSTRYEPGSVEAKWYPVWENQGYFRADESRDPEKHPPYTIVIPPPNVTGILHMGHALNNTIQDVLIRWKRMAGFNALWVPGTDHAGIATQNVVERALLKEKLSRHDLGREKFVERVWEWKEKHGNIIIEQLKSMGCSCDWTRERFTMDEGLTRAVRAVFKRLYDEGLIYKANYLINWCPRCLTTLADDEVEHADKDGKLWYLRYPVEGTEGQFAVVATTRPETMLGDSAVAVNPKDERYKALIGRHVILPLANRRIPIIADDFVDREFGTGMVKITPAHDPNDYQAGKRHGLPEINVLTPDAKMNEVVPAYQGLDRYEARKRIVADLEALGLVERIEDHSQRVGECYRCHTVIEPYISLQWFVKMAPLAAPAKQAVAEGRVKFHPKMREREYFYWLDNVRDWPISRQLWWGHRIPAWYGPDGEIFVTDEPELPKDDPRFASGEWTQDPDVLDTWFSSALWPFSTLGWPDETQDLKTFYPTTTLSTGKEIIFFWVARMIMMGLKFRGDIPFKDVYFHPVVADEHGKKMSKSKGNVINPVDLITEYGSDALRFTLCDYANQDQYVAFSAKRCEGYRNFMNKLWNAARLILANADELEAQDVALAGPLGTATRGRLPLEDKWILSRYARTVRAVNDALGQFKFDESVKSIYDFFWKDFCDYYIELVKPRLYGKVGESEQEKSRYRTTGQAMLVVVLEGALRLLHPVCPFITEELWSAMREKWGGRLGSITSSGDTLGDRTLRAFEASHLIVAPWNDFAPADLLDEQTESGMDVLQEVIYAIRNIRGEIKIPPGTAANILLVSPDEAKCKFLRTQSGFFRSLTNIGDLRTEMAAEPPANAATATVAGVSIYLEMPSEMREQEVARLEKELSRLATECGRQEGKLSNEAFVGKAPAAVVDKEREKLRKLGEELAQVQEKLAKIKAG
ncbi:MAG: valine--tRNA ligase [Candidatus Sumerlaeaceae bacterium]|nr:valine--tRNA ligase [Candidatus Sumerlaeaceae bacterium]